MSHTLHTEQSSHRIDEPRGRSDAVHLARVTRIVAQQAMRCGCVVCAGRAVACQCGAGLVEVAAHLATGQGGAVDGLGQVGHGQRYQYVTPSNSTLV